MTVLCRAAELIAREHDDATPEGIMDAFKRAIFAGELNHDSAGLQMEIEIPRCTLPPERAKFGVLIGSRTIARTLKT